MRIVLFTGDGLEQALARLWQGLLPAAASSPPDATFAVLGGDSLLAIKLMLGVEEITGGLFENGAAGPVPCESASTSEAESVASSFWVTRSAMRRRQPAFSCVTRRDSTPSWPARST